MVMINTGKEIKEQDISDLRVKRQREMLEKQYAERQNNNLNVAGRQTVPNLDGDPPSLVLWGEE